MRRAALLLAAVAMAIAVVVLVVPHLADESPAGAGDASAAADAAPESAGTADAKRRAVSAPRRGTAIDGVVEDAGAPAADVAVECVRLGDAPPTPATSQGPVLWVMGFSAPALSPAPAWRGVTDADGRFRSAPLPPGHWRVVARAGDGRAVAASVTVAVRADAAVRLVLPSPGFSLRGRVETADAGRVAARVALQAVTGRGFAPDEFATLAWTDAAPDGGFVFAGISARAVNVVASAGGEVVSIGPVRLPRDEPVVVRFDAGVTRRRGLVRDAESKAPVAGARIVWLAWIDHERNVGTQTTSDAAGRFVVPGLKQGRAYVEADGFATEHVWDHGGADEIVIELARLATIGGRVVAAADGRPIEGAVVRAIGRRNLDPAASATSDTNGAFRLADAAPGDAFVFVHGGGWTSVGLGAARDDGPNGFFVEAGTRDGLVLPVEPSATVAGRVIDAAGAPMPGARVTTWSRAFGHSQGPEPFPAAVCDDTGRFVLADLIPGATYQVRAKADGWAELYAEHVAGRPGELELRLLDSWFVDVRVVAEEDGHPIAGAKVRGDVREFYEVRAFGDAAVTDADGRARVGPGPRGEFGAWVEAPDRLRREQPWWVGAVERDGRASAEVRVPKGLTIAGRVEIPDGAPWNRIRINAGEVATDEGVAEFWTDTPEFRVERLAAGPHVVGATLAAGDGRTWSGTTRADAGATDVVIALTAEPQTPSEPQHTLVVRVLDADGGPVFSARIHAWCWRGPDVRGLAGEASNGVAELTVVDVVDRIAIDVTQPLDRQSRRLRSGAARIEMPDPHATEFVVRLAPARSIAGRVTDGGGRGVAGSCVMAWFAASDVFRIQPQDEARTWSGADGGFRLDGLGDGSYTIAAEVPRGWRAAAPVLVESGASDVAIVVEPVTPVRITVLDADGAPLVDARVVVNLDMGAARHDGTTGADGTFVVPDVPAGVTASLYVRPPDSRPDLFELSLPNWTPHATTIRLPAAAVISGTVRDTHGRPLAGVDVTCTGEGAPTAVTIRTDATGHFRVGRLRPGSEVGVFVELSDETAAVTTHAAAGTDDLAIVLDVGSSVRVRIANARRNEIEGPVRAVLADGSERWGRFGPDGVALLAHLPPGAVMKLAVGPTWQQRWAAAEGVVAGERDVELTLRDGATIVGRLEVPEESAGDISGIAERDGFRIHVPVDGRGFVAAGLPPGTWRLSFERKSRTGERYEGAADVETGTLDAVVRLVRKP